MEQWQDGKRVTDDLFHHIVRERSIVDIEQFITPAWPESLNSPLDLPDMTKACERVWRAISKKELMGIMGDYDMDGTPAAAILASYFSLFGLKPYVILPTRKEGYGFSELAVDRFIENGVSLIITVDCGIRDTKSVVRATERQCDVIITDHHECPEELPPALAIINPKRRDSNYPFQSLCGAAIAFKLVQALIAVAPAKYKKKIPAAFAEWSLDLVALATMADMVSLVNENRALVYYGLKVIRRGGRLGLRRLILELNLPLDALDYSDVAYRIIPKCNACGRLDRMDDVYMLLSETDDQKIEKAINSVIRYNVQSQRLLTEMLESAIQQVSSHTTDPVIVLNDDHWHAGLTGLVAGRIVELTQRPVAILAGVDDDYFRGSMRSVSGVNLVSLLEKVASSIEQFGGHEGAAGLTVRRDKLEGFKQAIAAQPISPQGKSFTSDGIITPCHVTIESLETLSQLKPWGVGHEEPVWSMCAIKLDQPQWLSDGKHVRATITDGDVRLNIIYFNGDPIRPVINRRLDICGNASINEYRGNRQPQFQIRSFRTTNEI